VSASKRYWKEDIIEPEVTVSPKGTIAISDKPGRGYEVRKELIEELTVRKATLAEVPISEAPASRIPS
jgi:O-succinylbenzoate synthase